MDETEALRKIRAMVGHSDYFYRYTNATVQLAGGVLRILEQVQPTDWRQRALTAEAELGRLRAEMRELSQTCQVELI